MFFRKIISTLAIDHGMYSVNSPIRAAILTLIGMSILWSNSNRLVSFAIGMLLTDINDPGGSIGMKMKFKIQAGIATILGSLLAAVVFEYGSYLVIPVAAVISFCAGLCSGFGPSEFLAGKIGVASFTAYIGVHPSPLGQTVAFTSIGFASSIAFTFLSEIPGSYDGLRTDLYKMYNSLGRGLLSSQRDIKNLNQVELWAAAELKSGGVTGDPFGGATATGRIMETRRRIEKYCNEEEDLEKMRKLVRVADHCRVAFVCLLSTKEVRVDEVFSFTNSVGRAAIRIGELCEFSLLQRIPWCKRRVLAAVDAVDEATANAIDTIKEDYVEFEDKVYFVTSIQQDIKSAATTVVDSPWSHNAHLNWSQFRSDMRLPPFTRSHAMWVYTIRFTIILTLACIPYVWLSNTEDHSNWFPLTVAFIALAGFGASISKIMQRTVGTILGLALGSILYWANAYSALLIILFAVVVFFCRFFFFANYGLFTMFITAFVYLLLTHMGIPLGITTVYRFCWTMAAEVLYTTSMFVYPPPFHDVLGIKLAVHAKAVHEYCQQIILEKEISPPVLNQSQTSHCSHYDTDAIYAKREAVMRARVAADAVIAEGCLTPRAKGFFRVEPHVLAPAINFELLVASGIAAKCSELLIHHDTNNSLFTEISDEEALKLLSRLADRLEGPDKSERIEYSKQDQEGNSFKSAIIRAHTMLTNAGL